MGLLLVLDRALLGFCAKISHQLQILTGKTNFFVAKMGILLSTLSWTLGIINYFHQILLFKSSVGNVVGSALFLLYTFSYLHIIEEIERDIQDSDERVANPYLQVVRFGIFRCFWASFLLHDTYKIFSSEKVSRYNALDVLEALCFAYGMLVFYYFIAVEPLSPRKSKLSQWIENLSARASLAQAGSGT